MIKMLRAAAAALLFAGFVAPAFAQTSGLQNPPLRPHQLALSAGTKTANATAGAATLAKSAGVITSEALTTAAAATYTLTITNSFVAAADQVFASVQNGTNSAGLPEIATVTPTNGTIVIVVRNAHASAAFNGTIKISFAMLKN